MQVPTLMAAELCQAARDVALARFGSLAVAGCLSALQLET